MDFNKFLLSAMPSVDSYVGWRMGTGRKSYAYLWFRGSRRNQLRTAVDKLQQYFGDIGVSGYHCNDGAGFTGLLCHYGTMPCLLRMEFDEHRMSLIIYRGVHTNGCTDYQPGPRLYQVAVSDEGPCELADFGNIFE